MTCVRLVRLLRVLGVAAAMTVGSAAMAEAGTIYWTDWTGTNTCTQVAGCFTGQGTITTSTSTVNVTYTNLNGVGFYNTGAGGETDFWANNFFGNTRNAATSPYTSTTVDNIPTGTDMIALSRQGSQTLTFSQAIANPVFSFVSLNGNGYAFLNQDFTILSQTGSGNDCGYWGCGNVVKVVIDLGGGNFAYQLNSTGGEPHGTIQFLGAFSTLTWTSSTNEFWNGFTVGVQGTAQEVFNPAVPEPGTLVLLGTGLAAVAIRLRRRRR